MKLNVRTCALVLTLGITGAPILTAVAQPLPTVQEDRDRQDRDRDQSRDRNDQNRDRDRRNGDRDDQWANNKYYKMGEKDGDNDRRHNRRGKHSRKFKNDDDRYAYEAGYQSAYGRRH